MRGRPEGAVVVVEIGSEWLKIAQIKSSPAGASLLQLHVERFEAADSALAARIAGIFKKLQLTRSPVVACLPRQMVNVRLLELPSTDPQEIADMVDLQSAKQTPYSEDEIVSDYRIVGEGRKGYTRVMLVIAQRPVLRQRFYVLEEAGVEVERMSVSSEGLLNWYRHAQAARETAAALLDVDWAGSDFVGLVNGDFAFTRSILIGSSHLSADADKWREKFGREVQQALEIFHAESGGTSPARLIVTGAGASIKGLREALQQFVTVPVELMDPLEESIELRTDAPALRAQAQATSLTPLIGMGLAPAGLRLNLVPDSVRMRRDLVAKARRMTVMGILLMTALFSVSVYATSALYLRKAQLDGLKEGLRRVEPVVDGVRQEKGLLELVARREDWRLGALNVLDNVRELVSDVKCEALALNLEKDKEQVMVEGSAPSRRDASALVQRFEQSPLFKDVKENRPTQQDDKTGRVNFQIVCSLEEQP